MRPITLEQLQAIYREAPRERLQRWLPFLNNTMEKYQINTAQRQRMFLAQIGHETGRLQWVREIWGPTPQQLRYEGTDLARRLGNTQPGDGKRYMGRGLIQVTGRFNYQKAAEHFGLPLIDRPEMLEQPQLASDSAGWFWQRNNLNALCDMGMFEQLTRRINGGTNGYADRFQLYQRALSVIPE